MRVAIELLPNGGYNGRMSMTGVHNPDAPSKVDEPVPISVGYNGPLGMDDGDRRYRRNSFRDRIGSSDEESAAPGTGNFGL
jgi:hypothetical protein